MWTFEGYRSLFYGQRHAKNTIPQLNLSQLYGHRFCWEQFNFFTQPLSLLHVAKTYHL